MTSTSRLDGKVALVTGSTRGIGWATARELSLAGATVVLNGVTDSERLADRVRMLAEETGGKVTGAFFDVRDQAAVEKAFRAVMAEHKRLDVLVNNAGVLENHLVGFIRDENVTRVFATNAAGAIYSLQCAARLMMRHRSGSIVNVTSIVGRLGMAGGTVYGASKAAVIGLTRSAAKELARHNIRVNAVAPGFIETDMVADLDEKFRRELLDGIRIGRAGTPEDVARVIRFLASDDAAYVTGQVIGVDGGLTI